MFPAVVCTCSRIRIVMAYVCLLPYAGSSMGASAKSVQFLLLSRTQGTSWDTVGVQHTSTQ